MPEAQSREHRASVDVRGGRAYECDSGDSRCVDDVAEECSGGEWVVFMDCYDCAGYCDFDAYGNAACFCP